MWEKVFEIFKRFFTISDELKRLQADSKLHGEQIRELIDNQTRLYYEFQLQKERNAHEREKETLRWKISSCASGWSDWRGCYHQPQPTKNRTKNS